MNLLHICSHYDDGKLFSVAWLPGGQSMMSTFTRAFWLAAAVICQLDVLCVHVYTDLCASLCVLIFISKQIHPSSPCHTGTCCLSLGNPSDSVHTRAQTPSSHSHYPQISQNPCPHLVLAAPGKANTKSPSSVQI